MKKIYRAWLVPFHGDCFFAEGGSIITFIHENDGNWRDEYFEPILEHLGATMVSIGSIDGETLGFEDDDDFECDGPWAFQEELKRVVMKRITGKDG